MSTPEPRSRGRFEAHYTPAGYIAHVLVDDVGLLALRDAFGVGPANPYAAAYSPMVADITGVPIYLDQCPCSVAEATSPSGTAVRLQEPPEASSAVSDTLEPGERK